MKLFWDRFFEEKKLVWPIIVLGSILFAGLLIGETVKARWWIIDDHTIMHFIGKIRSQGFSLLSIPSFLADTEVGRFGIEPRYRPTYFILYIVESFIWGDNPALWWAFRGIMFTIVLVLGWRLLSRSIGLIGGGIVLAAVLSSFYWTDIILRIGPGEIYCMWGLVLFLFGASLIFDIPSSTDRRLYGAYFLVTIGAFLAIGSKENFVFLAPFAALIWVYTLIKKKMNWMTHVSTALIVMYALTITLAIIIAIYNGGEDYYGQNVSSGGALKILLAGIIVHIQWLPMRVAIIALPIVLGALLWFIRGEKRQKLIRHLLEWGGVVFLCVLIYLLQIVFYHGQWPTGMRYDFPGMLAVVVIGLSSVLLLFRVLSLVEVPSFWRQIVMMILLCGIGVDCIGVRGYGQFISQRHAIVARSRAFTGEIQKTRDRILQSGEQVVFESYDVPLDYERIASVRRFLLAYGITNTMFLRLYDHRTYSSNKADNLYKILAKQLASISQEGRTNENDAKYYTDVYSQWGFRPLRELREDKLYKRIVFSSTNQYKNIVGVY